MTVVIASKTGGPAQGVRSPVQASAPGTEPARRCRKTSFRHAALPTREVLAVVRRKGSPAPTAKAEGKCPNETRHRQVKYLTRPRARGPRACTRAEVPFSARPRPAPGTHPISRALVGSARGVDLIHRD